MRCWRTAPPATSEASVIMLVGALDFGCTKREALARASLMSEKAATALSLHVMAFLLSLAVDS